MKSFIPEISQESFDKVHELCTLKGDRLPPEIDKFIDSMHENKLLMEHLEYCLSNFKRMVDAYYDHAISNPKAIEEVTLSEFVLGHLKFGMTTALMVISAEIERDEAEHGL